VVREKDLQLANPTFLPLLSQLTLQFEESSTVRADWECISFLDKLAFAGIESTQSQVQFKNRISQGGSMRRLVFLAAALCLLGSAAFAQDPVKVDPNHYKVVFENTQVRVLKFHYGPHEKSVMHSHPDLVVTFLTDAHIKFNLPDGTSQEQTGKAGDTAWNAAGKHLPENLSDTPVEGILVELKAKAPTHATPPPPKKQGS
jgi:quercetin dioxygenase-like cupin family protein